MNANTHPSAGIQPGAPALAGAGKIPALLRARIDRQTACSMVTCVHCGKCAQSCHYSRARPHDPFMTPAYKADQIRKIFTRHLDWMGWVFPCWVGAGGKTEETDLSRLKDIVFGMCSGAGGVLSAHGCGQCSPDTLGQGILMEMGVVPQGISNVCRESVGNGQSDARYRRGFSGLP